MTLRIEESVSPANANSGPAPGPNTRWDLTELIDTAHANSPALQRMAAAVDAAKGLRFQATRRRNPTLGYQAQEIGNEGQSGQHGIYWSQTWLTANKPELAGEVAGWEVQRRAWDLQTQRFRIAARVRTQYYNLLAARRVKQLSDQFLKIARNNLVSVEDLFQAGEIPRNELLQARIEAGNAELRAENTATAVSAAEQLLTIATASEQLEVDRIEGDLLADIPPLDREQVFEWLQDQSPELQSAHTEIQQTRWRINQALAVPIPNLNTQLGVLYDDSTSTTITNLQVSWQVPIRNANTGNIRAAQADARRARHALDELNLQLQDRLARAFREYHVSLQRSRAYEQKLLPMAKENLKITQVAYKVGEASYQTLLTSQRSYFDTALATVEARRVLWLAVARIQNLVVPE